MATPRKLVLKKAGRPPGSKNKATIILEKAKQRMDVAIAAKAQELLKTEFKIADLGTEAPQVSLNAIEAMFDRAFGRPTQRQEQVGEIYREPITIVHIFADGRESSVVHGQVIEGRPAVNVTKHLNSYGKVEKRLPSLDQD